MLFCGSCGGDEFSFGDAERSEGAFGVGLTPPVVDAGEVDVLPDLRGDVANDVVRQVVSFGPQALDDTGQVNGVPQDDGADHQVEAGSAESLALEGAVADFAALVEEDCPGQLVAGLALVQPGPAAVAQLWAGIPLGAWFKSG